MNRKLTLGLAAVLSISISTAACGGDESLPFGLKSEVVTPADRATVMAFAPDGRLFFGEQFSGNIRIVLADGKLQDEAFAQLSVANWLDLDWGLTGLAIDPDFETNHFVYAFFTEPISEGGPGPTEGAPPIGAVGRPKIVRFTEEDGRGTDETVVTAEFPETPGEHAGFNANGHIHFGPDGFLYASIGDYDTKEGGGSQNLGAPMGKLLRIDAENGAAAPDNPFAGQPESDPRIFAFGFREPFDFAFHPAKDTIYGTDNTTGTCEELNIIEEGENYGWPDVGVFPYDDCSAGDQVDAIYHFAKEGTEPQNHLSFVEVSGLAFLPGDRYPLLGESLLVCELGTKVLRRVVLGGADFDQVSANDVLTKDCTRDVSVSPDGTIYYSTDTEIRRLTVKETGA